MRSLCAEIKFRLRQTLERHQVACWQHRRRTP
jgi:hypothetical protein